MPIIAAVLLAFSVQLRVAAAAPCSNADNLTRVSGGQECLVIETFRAAVRLGSPTLFIVLHGDVSAGGPADYHYRLAEQLAHAGHDDVVAVAMIRPGYSDHAGNTSSGQNNDRRDSYTADNIDLIADAVMALKAYHHAGRIVLIGHSGGAAISAVILGRHPGLTDAAVLVGCPCDIVAWRSMNNWRPWPRSLSPDQYADRVPAAARIVAIVGSHDNNTRPALSEAYVAQLNRRGVSAAFVLVPDMDHNGSFRAPAVIDAAFELARAK